MFFLIIPSTPSPSCLAPTLMTIFQNAHIMLSLLCLHIHFISCDWERHLCVCMCLSSGDLFIFFGKIFLFLFLLFVLFIFQYFPFHVVSFCIISLSSILSIVQPISIKYSYYVYPTGHTVYCWFWFSIDPLLGHHHKFHNNFLSKTIRSPVVNAEISPARSY
jgi:hypothetical protein